MSANLDLVRSIYAAWERGDYGSADWAHPEIEIAWFGGPEPGRGTGIAAIAGAFREFLAAWDEWHVKPLEYRELDDGCIFVLNEYVGRAKTTHLDVDQIRGASRFYVRDGRVRKLVIYWDSEVALADLGLEE